MTTKQLILSLVAAVLSAAPVHATGADEFAGQIQKAINRPVGLVALPRGDAELALALAIKNPRAIVHVQAADPNPIRQQADAAGLLGRRVFVDAGEITRLLLVGKSSDLLVLPNLKPEELTEGLASEIRRVLQPWYGIAVFAPANPSLRKWAEAIGKVTETDGLILAQAAPIPGADDWPTWWHGPDNNAVSTDTAYSLPQSMQWVGKPFFSTRIELPIIASGRLFVLWNGDEMDTSPGKAALAGTEGEGPLLTAHSTGSGVILWAKRLSPNLWLQASRSTVVASGTALLVADGGKLLELDQVTGRELRSTDTKCAEVKWLTVSEGHVLILGGPATVGRGQRSPQAVVPFRSDGRELIALDRGTLKEQWRVKRDGGDAAIDPRSPAVAGDRIMVATVGCEALAYALADGRELWRVPMNVTRRAPITFEWDYSSRHPVTGFAMFGGYLASAGEQEKLVALSQEDGRQLWEIPDRSPTQRIPLGFDNRVWIGTSSYDPVTGGTDKQLGKADRASCSRLTAAPIGIIGGGGVSWDMARNEPVEIPCTKSACGAGSYVAAGLIWNFPSSCPNCAEWRGFMARAKAEQLPPAPPRLVGNVQAPAVKTTAAGWSSYRGDERRSAATTATVGIPDKILWKSDPAHPAGPASKDKMVLMDAEFVPLPPVTAGDLAIIAGSDGALDALKLSDGKKAWRAFTSGRISSSPTVWRDRVLVGSADGYVYAFALADGRELWRLRIAPQAGRMMMYGQLGSRWPVLGSPLVVNDRLYAAAGMMDGSDKIYVIAADLATGRLLWERNDWDMPGLTGFGAITGAGQLSCDGEEVAWHAGQSPLVRLVAATGTARAAYNFPAAKIALNRVVASSYRCTKGQDVGTIAPGIVAFGGRRLFTDQAEEGNWRCSLTFLLNDKLPLVRDDNTATLPAWDDKDVLCSIGMKRTRSLFLVSQSGFQESLRKTMIEGEASDDAGAAPESEANSDAKPAGKPGAKNAAKLKAKSKAETGVLRSMDSLSPGPEERWRQNCGVIRGVALTGDAAVSLEDSGNATWSLIIRSRADGKTIAKTALPAMPVYDGLAISTDGRLIVSLCDGHVLCIGR